MKILGIETSCDETALSLVEATGDFTQNFRFAVLGERLVSQAAMHAEYGGVFPNLAKREHAKNLVPLLEAVLGDAKMLQLGHSPTIDLGALLVREPELLEQLVPFLAHYEKPPIDALAVTNGPGLEPALWVGVNFAKALAVAWDLPIIAVNHMEGHIVMSLVTEDGLNDVSYPVLALLVSGGHTELVLSAALGEYRRLGATRDDAAGEAFDKIARLLDLPYPGGPEISRLASDARSAGLEAIPFTSPMLRSDDLDFSFSGLKTEVRRLVEKESPTVEMKKRIALGVENAISTVLVEKTARAADSYGVHTAIVGGGVSANEHIRRELAQRLEMQDCTLLAPSPALATDNARMIALAGYTRALKKEFTEPKNLVAAGDLKLG